jgi:hypothetical protein
VTSGWVDGSCLNFVGGTYGAVVDYCKAFLKSNPLLKCKAEVVSCDTWSSFETHTSVASGMGCRQQYLHASDS